MSVGTSGRSDAAVGNASGGGQMQIQHPPDDVTFFGILKSSDSSTAKLDYV